MNQKLVGIVLLFSLLVPLVGTISYLQYQKNKIHKEVKHRLIEGLDKEELVLLKFSKREIESKLHWEHSKEFEYNEDMYDVVKKKITEDSIYLWCWHDNKETALNKKLDQWVTNLTKSSSQSGEKEYELIEFYNKLFCSTHSVEMYFEQYTKNHFVLYKEEYDSAYPSPTSPPPWPV